MWAPAELGASSLRRRVLWLRGQGAGLSPVLSRRVEMLWRVCVNAALQSDSEVVDVEGRLERVAGGDTDAAAAGSSALFAARNHAAQRLGWPGFYPLSLALGELEDVDPGRVIGASERATRSAWQSSAGRAGSAKGAATSVRAGLDASRAAGLLAGMGLELARVRIDVADARPPLAPRTYLVAPPRDVRVVIAPVRSMASRRALWHELGHAAYAVHVDGQLPWSLALAPARCLDEAIAELVADLGESPACLVAELGLSPRQAREVCDIRRAARLSWQRWQLVRTAFERDAYLAPDADLTSRWRSLVREYVGETAPTAWTTLRHLRSDPGSQIEYLIANRVGRWLGDCLGFGNQPEIPREAGVWLEARLFRFGATRGWRELLGSLGARLEV